MDILDVLGDLRKITATPGRGCTRIAYTHLEDEAHDYVWQHLQSVPGLTRLEDAAGNMFIVPSTAVDGRGEPLVLVGSHLDTVIEGGWLDGALGVATGMYVVQRRATPHGADPRVGLVVFRDEEGVRFSSGLFGSRVFGGLCREHHLDAVDREGIRIRDVVPDPKGCVNYRPPVRLAGFLECHIEQGMRLVNLGKRVGVVTGIVGIRRFELISEGVANHAGTTEMRRRVDALVPVAHVVGRLPSLVRDVDGAVITCGRLRVDPGAPNIVPGAVSAMIEIRAGEGPLLDTIEGRLRDLVRDLEPPLPGGRLAAVSLRPIVTVEPTPSDTSLMDRLAGVLDARGVTYERLPSMAGHDTQHAAHRCPAGMFFIPSIDGISHSPAENSREEDITLAGETMLAWVERCVT